MRRGNNGDSWMNTIGTFLNTAFFNTIIIAFLLVLAAGGL